MKDDTQENSIDVQDTSTPSDGDAKAPRKDLLRYHTFRMVSVGVVDEPINQAYDIISTIALVVNLAVMIMNTFDNLSAKFGDLFMVLEQITVFFFAVDYMLRIYTAKFLYPESTPWKATLRYIFSFAGIIDLLSFLPFYLPVFFPAGASVFRMFRVARIMRLFRINAYYDSLNVITEVLSSKKQQLLSSVFIILVLMVAASLCMYSVENAAQPDVFKNAFSGIWWASSTLLTVGYGDIYPITTMGKVLGIAITFLGVGMVAIPTGIISAGFVEQYTRLKRIGESGSEEDIKLKTGEGSGSAPRRDHFRDPAGKRRDRSPRKCGASGRRQASDRRRSPEGRYADEYPGDPTAEGSRVERTCRAGSGYLPEDVPYHGAPLRTFHHPEGRYCAPGRGCGGSVQSEETGRDRSNRGSIDSRMHSKMHI